MSNDEAAKETDETKRFQIAIETTPTISEAHHSPLIVPHTRKHHLLGALVTRTLPAYTGPYTVGVCDVECAVEPRVRIGSFRHRSMSWAPGGLVMESVLFTLFYPAVPDTGKASSMVWFPRSVCAGLCFHKDD